MKNYIAIIKDVSIKTVNTNYSTVPNKNRKTILDVLLCGKEKKVSSSNSMENFPTRKTHNNLIIQL